MESHFLLCKQAHLTNNAHLTSTKLSGKYAARCDQQEDDAVWGREEGELHAED